MKEKKQAREIILSAEVIAHYTGLHYFDIIKESAKKVKNRYIERVLRNYQKAKGKTDLYRDIFDKEVIQIARMAESKGVSTTEVFKEYYNIQEEVKKGEGKIRSAIVRPFMMYFLASIIVYFSLGKILANVKGIQQINVSSLEMVYQNFWYIVLGIALFLIVSIVKFSRYIPGIKSAYREIRGYQYLSFILMMLKSGLSMVDVADVLKSVMKVKLRREGGEGVLEFLSGYLSDAEVAAVTFAFQTYEYEKIFSALLARRKNEFEKKINIYQTVISEVLGYLVIIPVGLMLYAIFSIVSGVSTMMS